MIAAILLAAGASHRMGRRNKLLLPWGGRTLIEHMLATLTAARVGQIIVVLGCDAELLLPFIEGGSAVITVNRQWSHGLTASIQTGLRAARHDASGFLVCFSDLPLLRTVDIDLIIADFENDATGDRSCITVPVYKGHRGHPILFSSAYRDQMLAHEACDGCRGIMTANATHVRETRMPDDHTIRDLDTPEAYWELLALSRG